MPARAYRPPGANPQAKAAGRSHAGTEQQPTTGFEASIGGRILPERIPPPQCRSGDLGLVSTAISTQRARRAASSDVTTPAATHARREGPIGGARAPLVLVPAGPLVKTVRVEDPASLFSQPTQAKRLFNRPQGPPFLADGTPEHRILEMLAAPSIKAVRRMAESLEDEFDTVRQQRLFEHVRDIALGQEDVGVGWGSAPAIDVLRIRLQKKSSRYALTVEPCWARFLPWAGARLGEADLAEMPVGAVSAAIAALASAHGYQRAFASIPPTTRPREPAWAHAGAIAALRCVLEGRFALGMTEALGPVRRRSREKDEIAWGPLLLAWHACREGNNFPGLAHLTAALAAADLRERVRSIVRPGTETVSSRPGGPPPDDHLAVGMAALHWRPDLLLIGRKTPWPPEWGGPDVVALADRLAALLGGTRPMALELFLDDGLAVAAVFAVMGFIPSAHAQMAATPARGPLVPARRALADAIARTSASTTHVIDAHPLGPDAKRVYERVRSTPDPNVAIGTPFWLIRDRGALVSGLMREGRRKLASEVRTLLDREDLRRDLLPFWILRGRHADTASLHALARWLADREEPAPTAAEWLRFLEDRCRALRERDVHVD